MGSSREMMISAIAEPTILLSIFTLALITRTTYLGGISQYIANSLRYHFKSESFSGIFCILHYHVG